MTNKSPMSGVMRYCRRSVTLVFAATTLTLFSSFAFNTFRIVPQDDFVAFQSDSQALVTLKLIEITEGMPINEGGFLRANKAFQQNQPAARPDDPSATKSYNSQFGFQGLCISVLHTIAKASPAETVVISEKVIAMLTAALLAGFITRLFVLYGSVAGVVAFTLIFFSVNIILFARNLYWASFLIYAPYILCAMFYPTAARNGGMRLAGLALLVAVVVFIKCLCGYEYITILILSCSPFLLYEGIRKSFPLRKIISHQAIFVVVTLLAFIFAFGTHIALLSVQLGNFEAAYSGVLERAAKNTIDTASLTGRSFEDKYTGLKGTLFVVLKYLSFQAVNIGTFPAFGLQEYFAVRSTYFGIVLLAGLIVAACIYDGKRLFKVQNISYTYIAIAVSLTWSFFCSVSWLLFARSHVINHFPLGSIIFITPFFLHLCFSVASFLSLRNKVRLSISNHAFAAHKNSTAKLSTSAIHPPTSATGPMPSAAPTATNPPAKSHAQSSAAGPAGDLITT